ncbi:MAG: sulfotransferase [Candidatus Omnitrophota bacterium]
MITDRTRRQMVAPRFTDFMVPRPVCLISANDGGSKLFQSYLDGHPALYNIPAYPMLYFYPHWDTWKKELAADWTWKAIIEKFCVKHASVIDSRRIPGLSGLETLGENKDEHIEIDETAFRSYLAYMLAGQKVERRTFFLAVHYAYALCKGEDISKKSVLLWHHHVYEYLKEFMADFPDAVILGMVRDPRSKIHRIHDLLLKVDRVKLNETDCMIYRADASYNLNRHVFDRMRELKSVAKPGRIYFIRHEDLALKLEGVMKSVSRVLDIGFSDSMLTTTFDGKPWWGHEIYNMPAVTGTYKRVLSKDWQKIHPKIEIFVFEGISLDLCLKYGYDPLYYRNDSVWNRMLLSLAILRPSGIEMRDLIFYLNPVSHIRFLRAAYREGKDKASRKDYTQNAAYYYKWTYERFDLWKERWYEKVPSRILYVICRYCRFWVSIFALPVLVFKRWGIYYRALYRRRSGSNFLPPLIG